MILGLAASLDLEVGQMDVKTTFLHGDLDKEIYMEQPEGFQVKGKEDYVCRLQKSLYGLKQAPRQWYKKIESVMGKQGYQKTNSDHCVFFHRFGDDDFIILSLYVDCWQECRNNYPAEVRIEQVFCYERLGGSKTDSWHLDYPR